MGYLPEYKHLPVQGPTPLPYRYIWKAAGSIHRAFEHDPFVAYLTADAKRSPAQSQAQNAAFITLSKLRQCVLTMENGSALAVFDTDLARDPTPMDRVLAVFSTWILSSYNPTAEQKKRSDEQKRKSAAVIEETIGDRLPSMIYLGLLATDPQAQGHGYGGSLVDAINDLADSTGRAVFLQSSNTVNDYFYNSHGFRTVGTYYLGDDNPEWNSKPVPIQIMVREPKGKGIQEKSLSPTIRESAKVNIPWNPLNPLHYRV